MTLTLAQVEEAIRCLDLTRDQFKLGQVIEEPRVGKRPATFDPAHPRYHRYEQYLVLSERVRTALGLPDRAFSNAHLQPRAGLQ